MPRRALRWVAACAALLTAVVVPPLAGARPAAAATPTTATPVMGPNLLSAGQLAAWYDARHHGVPPNVPTVGNDVTRLAQVFIDQGRLLGVRGDIAFVQSVLETGWFSFPDSGQIRNDFNNFAGLYAYNNRAKGTTCAAETAPSRCFPTPAAGVAAQLQLLRGYADVTYANTQGVLLPPADRRGVAPTWELFGGSSGKAIWATASDYGIRIIQLYSDALAYNGVRAACVPYYPGTSDQQSGNGYWVVGRDGGVFSFGSARFYGSTGNLKLWAPIAGSESTSNGGGYWLLGRDGGIFSYGNAKFYGSTGGMKLWAPVNGMERTHDNGGYWLVADDGGIFAFGDAPFYGSTGDLPLVKPVLGMERTKSGKGYWLFASDGGVFSFGDAAFYGSLGNRSIPAPIVAMQRTPSGKGYWMLGRDGKIYPFGDAKSYGDIAGCGNYGDAARLLVDPSGHGYWIATARGAVVALGDARRLGFPAFTNGAIVGLMLHP